MQAIRVDVEKFKTFEGLLKPCGKFINTVLLKYGVPNYVFGGAVVICSSSDIPKEAIDYLEKEVNDFTLSNAKKLFNKFIEKGNR